MHRYSRSESVPFDSFGAGEDGAGHDTAAAAAVNGQPAPAPRRDRYGILRLAAALVLACVALLAIPMAAHSGPNDATLHHFELRDSSNKVLPPVRPFDPNVARHYVYYTTADSIVNLTALPTDGNATIRFTRRPIVLQPALMGVQGTYYVPYGENRWTVVVTSANGRSTRQYSMYTRRFGPEHDPFRTGDAHSRNANLELLQVGKVGSNSTQELDPPLRTNLSVEDLQPARNRTYTVTVSHDTDQAWVRAEAAAGGARVAIRGNGAAGTNGDKHNSDLAYGENRVRITVTPDNRFWARVHRVKIIRELPPGESNELTATLTDLGIETEAQGGLLARTFELALSEPVRMPVSELKNHALSVNGGVLGKVTRVGGTSRLVDGRWVQYTDRWRIRVIVKESGTLTVAGNRACQLDGALCTDDGRQLDGTPSGMFAPAAQLKVSIEGPAEGGDEDDGRLDFEVSLSRAAQKPVRVRFRTIDSGANAGDATPNVDYLPADYTLEFGPGETTKTAPVGLYDDTIDDTGETVMVEISDARMILNRNGKSRAVSIATPRRVSGTIYNSDPLPRAWIARFGRTVADQVLDAVEARLRAARSAGVEIGVGGQRIGVASPAAGSRSGENSSGVENPGSSAASASPFGGAAEAEEAARLVAMAEWLNGETPEKDASHPGSWSMTPRELLLGSSFSLAAETDGGGFAGLWGRMVQTRFAGREGTLSLDGDVTTALLGADYAWDRWTTGLVLSHSTGEGSYRGGSSGEIEAGVTAVTPWAGYALTENLSVWGAAGYGAGELTLTQADGTALKTDLGMTLAAAGARGTLVGGDGPGLDAVADARWVRTTTARVSSSAGNLTAAQASVTRLRLGLEGSWPLALGDGATMTPRLGLGVRQDGGDAETGHGVDISGGIELASPAQGLTVSLDGRGMLTHEAADLRDRGIAGTLAWNPPPSNGRGPMLTLSQTFGTGGSSGRDALLARGTLAGLAANDDSDDLRRRRLEARFGYGSTMFGNRFTGTLEIGLGLSEAGRDYSLGWRLTRAGAGPGSLEFLLEAHRRESANGTTHSEHGIGFRLTAGF